MPGTKYCPDTTPVVPGDLCYSTELGKAVVVKEIVTDGMGLVVVTRGDKSKTAANKVVSRDTLKLCARMSMQGPVLI